MKMNLKPQDVLLALKLIAGTKPSWKQLELATALHLSVSEVNHSLKRLTACHLFNPNERRVIRAGLLEFLVSGLRYVFPARLGLFGEGMPTSLAASALQSRFRLDANDLVVWSAPHHAQPVYGRMLEPLYKSVPLAAAEDPILHEYLALADTLRVGRARERALAKEELERKLAS